MISSAKKAKDDIIGGRDFSRVRRFDDEARKARIFAPDAGISVDVKKLEDQLKEKQSKRELEESLIKKEETEQALEKKNWDQAEEELRCIFWMSSWINVWLCTYICTYYELHNFKTSLGFHKLNRRQRIQERAALEEAWQRQDKEFKERWKHEVSELNPDKVGFFPAKRYEFQDNEKIRDGEAIQRISEAWRQQIEEHNLRMRMEREEREKNDSQLDRARKNWERSQQEISKQLFESNVDLANEYLQLSKEKIARDRRTHYEEHLSGITEHYFKQFGKTSR